MGCAFEGPIQSRIIAYLKARGAFVLNIPGNEFAKGIPDILVCWHGLWVAFEVKSPDGSLRPEQKVRMRRIQKAGGVAEAVRSVKRVKFILECIDTGTWTNGEY